MGQLHYIYKDCRATLRLGGGGHISDSILGAQDTYSYKLFKILKILGGGGEHILPCSAVPDLAEAIVYPIHKMNTPYFSTCFLSHNNSGIDRAFRFQTSRDNHDVTKGQYVETKLRNNDKQTHA